MGLKIRLIQINKIGLSILLFVIAFTGYGQQPIKNLPANFDKYIQEVLQKFHVPGLAIAIVKDGKVILSQGYGVREMGKSARVDEHTLFPIASNSKAFTATALALLVEEGKLEWDAPVINYLPDFRMSDPYVTSALSVRDLLVHRSGLAPYAGDLLQFPPSSYTREEIVHKLRYIPLATSFRSTYAYDNILYLVAAEVIKAVSGQEWEEFVQQRIFDKIGMQETISQFSRFQPTPNRATSHAPVNGRVQVMESFFKQGLGDVSNPAGGIVSNVTDMSKWLLTQLDSGRISDNQRLFSPSTATELWAGVTPMKVSKINEAIKPAQMDFSSYALGFRLYTYRGEKMVAHGGKLDGFVSYVNMVPEKELGIAILTNQECTNAYMAILNHLLDHFLEKEPFDWISGYRTMEDLKFRRITTLENEAVASRNTSSKPLLPLDSYAGHFEDPWYGPIAVTLENNKLIMRFEHSPELIGDMDFWQYNTFVVRWRNRELRADAYVTYALNEDGSIDQIKMKAISPITDVSYDFHDLLLKPAKTN